MLRLRMSKEHSEDTGEIFAEMFGNYTKCFLLLGQWKLKAWYDTTTPALQNTEK